MKRAEFADMLRGLADRVASGESRQGGISYRPLESDDPDELHIEILILAHDPGGEGIWLELNETRPVPVSDIDLRRLRDGTAALALSMETAKMSPEQLLELRRKLFDGAVALQSMDSLGSEEANDAAMKHIEELDRRIRVVDAELASRSTKP